MVFTKSSHTFQFNLLSDALREDLVNAVNIPLLDSRGEKQSETFRSRLNSNAFTFITKIRSGKQFSNSLVQVEYQLKDNKEWEVFNLFNNGILREKPSSTGITLVQKCRV